MDFFFNVNDFELLIPYTVVHVNFANISIKKTISQNHLSLIWSRLSFFEQI